jgi:hypothetical protein
MLLNPEEKGYYENSPMKSGFAITQNHRGCLTEQKAFATPFKNSTNHMGNFTNQEPKTTFKDS